MEVSEVSTVVSKSLVGLKELGDAVGELLPEELLELVNWLDWVGPLPAGSGL